MTAVFMGDCGGATATYFKLINAINRNYPERVWRTIILNAPSIFGVIWSIVSPLLEPNVREKITVLRGNYEDTLRELVAPENLPVAYGGTDAGASPDAEFLRGEDCLVSSRRLSRTKHKPVSHPRTPP